MNRWLRGCLPVARRACAPIVNTPRLRTATSLVAGPGSRVTAVAAAHHRLRRCTERSSSHDARLSVCTYLHTCGDTRNGEIGAAWVGLGGLVGSIPVWVQCTPRGQLPFSAATSSLSSSLNPLQTVYPSTSCSPLSICVSLFLRFSFYVSRHRFLPPSPFFPHRARILLFVLAGRSSFRRGSSIGESRGMRGEAKVVGMKRGGCGRVGISRGSKEDSLRMVMVRRRSG